LATVHTDFAYDYSTFTWLQQTTLFRPDTCQNSTIMEQPLLRTFNDDKTSHHY